MAVPVPSSASGGYIVPQPPPSLAPLYGDALEDVFHDVIKGVLGFTDGTLIRPRWQPNPPNQPDFGTDWVAFGIMERKGDWSPYQAHDPTGNGGDGSNIFERDEELTLLHSYYGPNSAQLQSLFQDGLLIEQNRAALTANGIKLIEFKDAFNVPALLKETWVKKVDQRIVFKRRIRREYAIVHLLSANVSIDNEQYITQIVVT